MFDGVFSNLIPEVEGRFLAGYVEGECHLGIGENNGGQSAKCWLEVRVRDDDRDLLEWLMAVTGQGRLPRAAARANSAPQIGWHVGKQAGCAEIVRLLTRFPLPGVTDFMRWRLRTGADVPSDATYYRVFGGGWETVLTAYRKTRAQAAA